jgi:hypothetical protein
MTIKMKRLSKGKLEKLKPVVLYNDDIHDLVEILNRSFGEIKIEAASYELEHIQELEKISGEKINELKIEGQDPHISIELKPYTVSLCINDDTHHQLGAFEEVKQFLNSKCSKFSWLIHSTTIPAILLGLSLNYIIIVAMEIYELNKNLLAFSILLCLISIAWIYYAVNSSSNNYSVIYLKKERKDGSFFRRKKDEIILSLISMTFGAVVSIILNGFIG